MAGTACGGMDQTISIMGRSGTAMKIDFVPDTKCTDVKIPDSVALVIKNSATPSPKLLTLGTRYNKRVVECRFAVSAMSLKAGESTDFLKCPFTTFEELQKQKKLSFSQMLDLAKSAFKSEDAYSLEMIQKEFGVGDPFKLVKDVPHINKVKEQNKTFDLYKRALHVLSEAKRVHDFAELCSNEVVKEEKKVKRLGALMNESHESCRDNYDCSSKELDELTQMARDNGALGSRLTGAGWGGCCVSLVKKDEVEEFIKNMKGYYTKKREPGSELDIT